MIPVRDSNGNLKKGSEDLSFLILSEYMNGKRSGIVELGNNRYFWEQKKVVVTWVGIFIMYC